MTRPGLISDEGSDWRALAGRVSRLERVANQLGDGGLNPTSDLPLDPVNGQQVYWQPIGHQTPWVMRYNEGIDRWVYHAGPPVIFLGQNLDTTLGNAWQFIPSARYDVPQPGQWMAWGEARISGSGTVSSVQLLISMGDGLGGLVLGRTLDYRRIVSPDPLQFSGTPAPVEVSDSNRVLALAFTSPGYGPTVNITQGKLLVQPYILLPS